MTSPRTLASLALMLSAAGSCRSYDLCEDSECQASFAGRGGDGASGSSSIPNGGDNSPGAGMGSGGEALVGPSAAGDSGAAGEATLDPLVCEAGTADCDHSRLTGCETHLSWTVRHCGACGVSCEDGCEAGQCLQSSLLTIDFEVTSFISTRTFAFAILSNIDGTDTFVRVRVDSGEPDVLANVGDSVEVFLGDRVYLFDSDASEIRSVLLDGTAPRVEAAPNQPRSVGAYPGGTYYIGSVSGAEGDSRSPLYYRPHADSPWRELVANVEGSLWSSSQHGVVYSELLETGDDSDEEVRKLYLLQGDRFIPYELAPPGMRDARATAGGITVLTYDYQTYVPELWWLTLESPPMRYALPAQSSEPRMRTYRDGVALSLVEGQAAYVQAFGSDGPNLGKIGVRLGSVLLGLEDRHLWHLVYDDWFHWRFLRTDLALFGF